MTILSDNQVTIYEEPVVERVRKFIRMESLFHKLFFFKDRDNPMESYVALQSLCEIYEILSRSDIKSELIREIENQNKMFKKIQDIPQADSDKLNSVLEKQKLLLDLLHGTQSNYIDYLSSDVLFKTIQKNYNSQMQPASVDFWLSRDIAWRANIIDLWIEPLLFIKKSIDFILELIRKSGQFNDKLAEKGFYIDKLDPKKNILLVRITLATDLYYFPQISVGKQRLNIMFMTKDELNNFTKYQENVSFLLTLCSL
tara:strand:- start:20237 stop:21004 length:768 start_codon:yes stop_codon:yes gene_type:complete